MSIPESFLKDLLTRVDVVDVVGRVVPLKKKGTNYSACCPFHQEKTPSFTVSQTKQFYHCFGCGAHGDAIGFMREYHGLGFLEAVEALAKEVGLTIPDEQPTAQMQKQKAVHESGVALLLLVAKHYQQALKQSPEAIAYLKHRGLTGATAAKYGIGYAPEGYSVVRQWPEPDVQAQLIELGVLIQHEQGRIYDRFRGRVMFPIQNRKGEVIGFGGRILDRGEPKYLNSPETPLFNKGWELYGLPQARAGIKRVGRVLVVEGYMDVVMLAQHGVDYAVATLGTATTEHHLQQLFKQTDWVQICFDGDRAGRKAAWRALQLALPLLGSRQRLEFVFLPPEHDPDSYIRAHGTDSFESYLQQKAQPLAAALWLGLTQERAMDRVEERAKVMAEAKTLLQTMQDQSLQLMLQQALAQSLGLSLDDWHGRASKPRSESWVAPARDLPLRPKRGPGHWSAKEGKWIAEPQGASGPRTLTGLDEFAMLCLLLQPERWRDLSPALQGMLSAGRAGQALFAWLQSGHTLPPEQPPLSVLWGKARAKQEILGEAALEVEWQGAVTRLQKKVWQDELNRLKTKEPLSEHEKIHMLELIRNLGG